MSKNMEEFIVDSEVEQKNRSPPTDGATTSVDVTSNYEAPKDIASYEVKYEGPRRGRPRKSKTPTGAESQPLANVEVDAGLGRRRSAARATLPIDDEDSNYYPCPVDVCDLVGKTRMERNFHLRADHPGYVYAAGDGANKVMAKTNKKARMNVCQPTPSKSPKPERTTPPSTQRIQPHDVKKEEDKHSIDDELEEWAEDEEHFSEMDEVEADYDEVDQHYREHMKPVESRRDVSHSDAGDIQLRKRGRPKNPPGSEPAENSKVRVSDPSGKYRCYIPDCVWRGGYRSIRADHMRWCHKDWQLPPRYILQRISRDGVYIDPNNFDPEYNCLVEGCTWKGNFRASRSTHMRTAHPEFNGLRKKAPAGGFTVDGKYECHEQTCAWRGSSRSTRAAHMKREHPGFINPIYTQRNLPCCDCEENCPSHKSFVDHMVCEHRIGGLVQREFNDVRDYEEWFDAVQDSFSVEFVKRMGIKQTDSYQVLYLYCARSGGYRPKRIRTGHPFVSEYAKRRSGNRSFTKCGKNCAAFLRVVHWMDGRLTVVGCVEHTGHRMGTALLRLSPSEREVMDEYLYMEEEETPLEFMIDRLREAEGFCVDGYEIITRTVEEIQSFIRDDTDELKSLLLLLSDETVFPPGSTFNVTLVDQAVQPTSEGFTLGIMTKEMKELWTAFSPRAACIEEVRLMISSWDVSLTFVLVFDETDTPRCACIYISQQSEKTALLRQLRDVYAGPVETFVTDSSSDWPHMLEEFFGESGYSSDNQIAEWHLLPEWASSIEQYVTNKVDRFAILCALRRWIRTADPTLFESMVIDMFEALREMELDDLAQTLDAQLTIPEYAKRWDPLNRNNLTEHSNPMLEIVCRTFRERFLNCQLCSRLDEYIGLLLQRVTEFNNCVISAVYSTASAPDPPRQIPHLYDDIDPANVMADGTLIVPISDEQMELDDIHTHDDIDDDDMEHKRIKLEVIDNVIREEIVEEEIVEELIIEGTEAEQLVAESLGGLDHSVFRQSTSGETESNRKARIKVMMQKLKDKMDTMADDESMELVESSLSQVVTQLDSSI